MLGLPNQMSSISGPPIAIFSAPNHICPGTCTDFTNLSVNATSFLWSFPGANPAVSTDANPTQICYNIPGQYSVTLIASNPNGNDTLMLPNFITVYPQPSPQGIQQSGDTLFANQGASGYQWFHDGNIIAGATEYFYVATESGNFNVVATDVNGCEVEAVIFDVVANTNPIAFGEGSGMSLSPNPAMETLFIRGNQIHGKEIQISVYNMLGRKVNLDDHPTARLGIDSGNPNGMLILNISPLSAGMYFLEVVDGEKMYVSKFTKQ
jgi:hypothetical protein